MLVKNIYIAAFTLLLASAVGCDGFLDREPLDQLSEDTFYKTASDANKAAISMYAIPQGINWFGKAWIMLEIPSDNTTVGGNDPDFSPIDNFTINPDNTPNLEFWTEHYRLVTAANQIVRFVPDIDMDIPTRNAIVGEARFLRAYAYFDLVRIYGDVPIVTEVPDINTDVLVPRDPVEEVYDFLIEDLQYAVETLPDERTSANQGRPTNGAAKALLSKVYLTLGMYDEAMMLCREIIGAGRYTLMADYADNWLRDVSDNNAESIWQIQYTGCGPLGTGNANQGFFAPWGQNITKNSDGWGSQIPTGPLIDNPGTTIRDVYTDNDLRRYHTYMAPLDFYPMLNPEEGGYTYPAQGASRSGINIKKYVIGGGPDVCFLTTPQNVHVIRYADVLLMLAEASCKRNGGITVTPDVIEAYNQVLTRAGLEPVGSVTTAEVYEQRRLEFAFENHRWFDLLREGNVRETMQKHGKGMQEHHKLFPIPAPELAINPNLTQNEGY